MSEELFGAIKFQHRNLLHLIDILRNQNEAKAGVIRDMVKKLKSSEDDKRFDPCSRLWESGGRLRWGRMIGELQEKVEELERRLGDRVAMPPPQMTYLSQ